MKLDGHIINSAAYQAIEGMHCDVSRSVAFCFNPVTVAPRIYVPSKTQQAPGHDPLRMMTPLHYCELHQGALKLDEILTDKVKADFEDQARKARPLDFKCDFDSAFVHYVSIFSSEYKTWLARLDKKMCDHAWGHLHAH